MSKFLVYLQSVPAFYEFVAYEFFIASMDGKSFSEKKYSQKTDFWKLFFL